MARALPKARRLSATELTTAARLLNAVPAAIQRKNNV
jgi:hypothetical protein